MLLLNTDPSDPYVPFIETRHRPWWLYESPRRGVRFGTPRRLLGNALIRAGRAVAAEQQAPALG
jgi:hypothetical protein